VLLLTLVLVSGCGGPKGSKPKSVPLAFEADAPPSCELTNPKASGKKEPLVYKCNGDLFLTTLKECSIPDKFTMLATTRQLLVGFASLKLLKQSVGEFAGAKALESLYEARFDVDDLYLMTFSLRREDCVQDMVAWTKREHASSPESFSEQAQGLARLVSPPPQAPSGAPPNVSR